VIGIENDLPPQTAALARESLIGGESWGLAMRGTELPAHGGRLQSITSRAVACAMNAPEMPDSRFGTADMPIVPFDVPRQLAFRQPESPSARGIKPAVMVASESETAERRPH